MTPHILAAAKIAGVTRIYKVGGAQAVAALAYGTGTIPQVDKIVGPGNAYVAEAKRQVFGRVNIDMIAGPSEVLVLADGRSNPAWVAADLLSQAEHDRMAAAVLVTDSRPLAEAVAGNPRLASPLKANPRRAAFFAAFAALPFAEVEKRFLALPSLPYRAAAKVLTPAMKEKIRKLLK